MNTAAMLDYLAQLEANNDRAWYHSHKEEHKAASATFEELLRELIVRLGKTDASVLGLIPGELTFKLARDTRFSHDKSPYHPAFRAHIGPKGKLPIPVGYYLMIRPGDRSFLGGGLFADVFKDATAMVRDAIAANGSQWQSIVEADAFRSRFQVQGAGLKRVPAGYDASGPHANELKRKSWYLEYPVGDETVRNPEGFLTLAAEVFEAMRPFNGFLNQALDGFVMPAR